MSSTALSVKKLFIDSRYRTADSNSDSDFKIQLARNIYLPEETIMHIENVVIPHSWYTIEEGINDRMYFQVVQGSNTTYTTITIPSTNYTGAQLMVVLQSALNASFPNLFTVSYNIILNRITISISSGIFKVLTDSELATYVNNTWNGPSYNSSSPKSCNDIITNRTVNFNNSISPFVSGMLNLQGFRAVYISSSTLSNYDTLGPQGEQNIIRKIPTTSDFGYLIIDSHASDHNWLECSKMSLKTIDFQLKDAKGDFINFRDSPVSFTVVFSVQR
jgi:hypothetical protein